jgi:spore coat protein U-like protein
LAVIHPVSAATSAGSLAVTASVTGVCIIGNATLAFGPYDPTAAAAATANTTVTLTCSLGTLFNIGMNAGIGVGATTTLRVMTSGSGTLVYGLFPDPSFTVNWGNILGTNTVSGTSSRGGSGFSDGGVSGYLSGQYSNRRADIHEKAKT